MSKDAPSEVLHRAILDHGSPSALAEASKVPLSSITRFLDRTRSLSLATFDALSEPLGLKLVQGRRPKAPPKRGR